MRGTLPAGQEHPPLAQIIAAVPLLWMGLRPPSVQPSNALDEKRIEHEFLFDNVRPAEDILTAARIARLTTTILLGIVIAWWSGRRIRIRAALVALALFISDPNFLAHGHCVTNDAPVALTFVCACLVWCWFLEKQTIRRAIPAGIIF